MRAVKVSIAVMMVLVLIGMGSAMAAEASVSVDAASAYVFRGVTLNDGFVIQPGVEVSGLPAGVDIGVWANINMDDYDGAASDDQVGEIDIYASYGLPIEGIDLSVGYTEYTYPGLGGDPTASIDSTGAAAASSTFGESDREVSLSLGLGENLPLSPSISAYYGLGGLIDKQLYVEASVGHEISVNDDTSIEIGATVAYLNPDKGEDGFSHATASLSGSYKILNASVTYVGRIDDDVLADAMDGTGYDVDVYGTVGISCDF